MFRNGSVSSGYPRLPHVHWKPRRRSNDKIWCALLSHLSTGVRGQGACSFLPKRYSPHHPACAEGSSPLSQVLAGELPRHHCWMGLKPIT